MHTQACTLKHRPAVLPQDAVFQLFKPQLKLAAQPLEGKAGRIPVITVWLVEWLQLASLSLEDLHTYKKAQGSKVQLQEIFLYYSDTSQEVKKKDLCMYENSQKVKGSHRKYSLFTPQMCHHSQNCARNEMDIIHWKGCDGICSLPIQYLHVSTPAATEERLSSGPPLSQHI